MTTRRGAGGTPGGVGTFVLGLVLTLIGAYLLFNQIQVTNNFWGARWGLFGGVTISAFGVTLVPFLIGVALIFYNVSSRLGWILAGGSLLVMLVGIIVNLQIYFAPTSLYVTLMMLVLLVGGIGLMLRSLLPYP